MEIGRDAMAELREISWMDCGILIGFWAMSLRTIHKKGHVNDTDRAELQVMPLTVVLVWNMLDFAIVAVGTDKTSLSIKRLIREQRSMH